MKKKIKLQLKKLLYILLFFFTSLISNGQNKYDEAKSLLEQGNAKKALSVIEKDIIERGYLEENAILISLILSYIDGDKCFEAIQKAIIAFPKSAKVYHTRAMIYYEMRDLNSSILDDTKALELCTDDSLKLNILLNRSANYHHSGQLENSINDCNMALKIVPDDIIVLNDLSTILFDKGETDESIKILLNIKEINPKFIGAYINLGYQNQQMGKYNDAEKYLLEGISIESENSFLLNNLGFVQHKLGKSQEGIKNINKASKIDPRNSYCYRNLALIYLDQNDKDKACECIKKAISLGFTKLYGSEMKELFDKYCL